MASATLRFALGFALAAASTLAFSSPVAPNGRGARIARLGAVEHGTPACQSCHGRFGEGYAQPGAPWLAGQEADYLRRQLDAFGRGDRQHVVMQAVAKSLDDQARDEVAEYYSGLDVPILAKGFSSYQQRNRTGAVLVNEGRWTDALPPCSACHAADGRGSGAVAPPLAAQSAAYIEGQLLAWRRGERRGDVLNLMSAISKKLTPAEIKAVAAYYGALQSGAPK